MRLTTLAGDRIAVQTADGVLDKTDLLDLPTGRGHLSRMRQVIERFDELAPVLRDARGQRLTPEELVFAPPVPDPSKIIAAPVNYQDHKSEMQERFQIDDLGVFLKTPSSVLGHRGIVRLPYHDRRFDHEAELGLVIGQGGRDIDPPAALGHVFAYTGLLDMTLRGGEDRSTRKSFDTFTPMGPWLVTPDEFGDPASADLVLRVGRHERQRANTRDLIWAVPDIIAYVSSVMTLCAGDVIATGTPAGVGPVVHGDEVTLEVSRVGALQVSIRADDAVSAPTRGAGRGPVPPPPPSDSD
jgi:2-keto-4-pentenoate hydratase/2-oxohepta-3-ene-1,7-dioic acid hydratase in catechol pathway